MLQIRLGADQPAPQPDPLGRDRIGYRPGMSEAEAWEAGRGVWVLKADRVLEQRELQIIDPDGIVRAVGLITGVRKFPTTTRYAVEGRLLLGDPRVGKPTATPHPSRNSVAYFGSAYEERPTFILDPAESAGEPHLTWTPNPEQAQLARQRASQMED